MAICEMPCCAGTIFIGGMTGEVGLFPKMGVTDTEGKEWHGFDGYPSIAFSIFTELGWERVSADVVFDYNWLEPYLGKDFSTASARQIDVGAALLLPSIGLGYSFPIEHGLELQTGLGHSWSKVVAGLDLQDKQTGAVDRLVFYRVSDRGIYARLNTRVWQDHDSIGNHVGCPKLQVEYQYSRVLGGLHAARAEFKIYERYYTPDRQQTGSFLLVASTHIAPSIVTLSAGVSIQWWL